MSIIMYKTLNKDVITKLQDLKETNTLLTNEVRTLNAKFFDEHQIRIEEKQKFISVINHLESQILNVKRYLLGEDDGTQWLLNKTRNSKGRFTRSNGVIERSPMRSRSLGESQLLAETRDSDNRILRRERRSSIASFSNIEEASSNFEDTSADNDGDDDDDDDDDNCDGDNITTEEANSKESMDIPSDPSESEEESSLKDNETLIALNRLTIKVTNEKNDESSSFEERSRYDNTPMQITCSDESQENAIVDVPQNRPEFEEERSNNNRQFDTSSSRESKSTTEIDMMEFSLNTAHSTPINVRDETACGSSTITDNDDRGRETSINYSTGRPRRKCAPTSFVEQNLLAKLRNENFPKKGAKK